MRANKLEDIWSRIDRRELSKCWIYTGGTFGGRYGRFCFRQKTLLAHRVVYWLVYGKPPDKMHIMHKCNNKLCCNPRHLICGTPQQNAQHAAASNAFPVGASGLPGIGFIKNRGYWRAYGWLGGKSVNLYTGPHKHKAIAARQKWISKHGITFSQEFSA